MRKIYFFIFKLKENDIKYVMVYGKNDESQLCLFVFFCFCPYLLRGCLPIPFENVRRKDQVQYLEGIYRGCNEKRSKIVFNAKSDLSPNSHVA